MIASIFMYVAYANTPQTGNGYMLAHLTGKWEVFMFRFVPRARETRSIIFKLCNRRSNLKELSLKDVLKIYFRTRSHTYSSNMAEIKPSGIRISPSGI